MQQETSKPKQDEDDLCPTHSTPLAYYCKSCCVPICSDCAVFGNTHTGHTFEKLSAVYEQHVERVKAEAVQLRKRAKDLRRLMEIVESNIEQVTKAKEARSLELRQAVEQMQAQLDQQLKSKLLTLLCTWALGVWRLCQRGRGLGCTSKDMAADPRCSPEGCGDR